MAEVNENETPVAAETSVPSVPVVPEVPEAAEPEPAPETPAPPSVSELRRRIFEATPLRRKLERTLRRLAGKNLAAPTLLLTGDDALDAALREGEGGDVFARTGCHSEAALGLSPEGSVLVEMPKLPFAEAELGGAVLVDALEYTEEPTRLMEALHKALAPKSRIVLHVRRKRRSLTGFLRRVTGLVDAERPAVVPGFTPSELFEVMKEGFDVEETVAYGRFFGELAEWLAELFAGVMPQTTEAAALDPAKLSRCLKVFRAMKPLFALAKVLDAVCFFLPTHHWCVRAKRRLLWAPRISPRLRDGRPFAEAVMSGKIGSAVGQ